MKRKFFASLSLLSATVLLAACGNATTSTSPPSAPTVAPATTAATTPATTASTASSTPSPTSALSVRGNIIKTIGEGAGVTDPTTHKDALTFTINKITVDQPCTEQYAQAPQNGHFVALSISAKTTSGLSKAVGSRDFTFNAAEWKLIEPNGTTFNGYLSGHAYGCIAQDKELPQSIGPGENVTGMLLLDVPTTSGTLVFQPMMADSGWEWKYKK